MITKADAVRLLGDIVERDVDPEAGHKDADRILLALIDDDDVFEAWKAVRKWYA